MTDAPPRPLARNPRGFADKRGRENIVEVRPSHDTVAVLERMRRAHNTELNIELKAKRRAQRVRRRENHRRKAALYDGSRQEDPLVTLDGRR